MQIADGFLPIVYDKILLDHVPVPVRIFLESDHKYRNNICISYTCTSKYSFGLLVFGLK